MLEVAFLAFMAALVVAFAMGARVALTAPRTPTAPERWIGFSILTLVVGAVLEGVDRYIDGASDLLDEFRLEFARVRRALELHADEQG